MPDWPNPAAASLQNAGAIQGLFNSNLAGGDDLRKMLLQQAFAQKQAVLESNLAMQRQAQSAGFESQRQQALLEAEKERAAAGITSTEKIAAAQQAGETSREAARLKTEADVAAANRAAMEKERQDSLNQQQAFAIRNDPQGWAQKAGIDLSKYAPGNPADDAKLVQEYNQKVTPDFRSKFSAQQVQDLGAQSVQTNASLRNYVNTADGQKQLLMRLLSQPDLMTAVQQSHNVSGYGGSYGASVQQLQQDLISQSQTDPSGALNKLYGILDQAGRGALPGILGGGTNQSNQGQIAAAIQQARSSLYDPQTAPPAVQNIYRQQGVLSQLAVGHLGNINNPDDFKTAFATPTPLTNTLLAHGATGPAIQNGLGTPAPSVSGGPPSANLPNPVDSMYQPDQQTAMSAGLAPIQ